MIQIGSVEILLSAKSRAYFCKSMVIEMGDVSRPFSKVSGSRVDLILLNNGGTDSFEKFTAEFSTSAPVAYEIPIQGAQ